MRRSIATMCLSDLLENKLKAIAAAGFDAAQICESDLLCSESSPEEIRDLAQELGLALDCYLTLVDFEGLDQTQFEKALARAEHKFDVMEQLGTPILLVAANTRPEASGDTSLAASHLRELAQRAASRNLKIAYGPLPWGTHVRRIADAWKLIQLADHPALSLALNSYYAIATGEVNAALTDVPGDRIGLVQICDAPRIDANPQHWNRLFGRFPGQGDRDIAGFVCDVLRRGYSGTLCLEVQNDDFMGISTYTTAEDGYRSLLFLEEKVGAILTKKSQVGLFDPPAPPHFSSISLLEFAVASSSSASLGDWLKSFGFAQAGTHRSKRVFLHRNGKVNLVINSEPGSFAESYYFAHGPSVCAMTISTDDERQAMARAVAFKCKSFVGKVGPNELNIPAIRMLEGSLIYFIGEAVESHGLYEIDFTLDGSVQDCDFGLETIDHLACSVPPGQLESRVLFYRSVLGFDADATWMLSDPNGVVKSRAVSSSGHGVRIPINMSQNRRTAAGRSVDQLGGAGVNHIAFSCADIFRAARYLRASGARLLRIPANYYDDIGTRFDLEDTFVESLKDGNILYDRIGSGEFLHIYSESFEDRFFFEFVQRIGGYDAYGAANAPVRLAAAARLQQAKERQSQL